ncbi:MAG TPA: SH3 domain-containing protein [Anaerolineales bacterium]|nr:SH3 domain-containing protein [Anaerolineales bacterium]
MTTASGLQVRGRKRFNWAPYLLMLPSLIYLALFFAWPMVQGLILAVREEGALLTVRSDAERNSDVVAELPRGIQVDILERQGNEILPDEEVSGSVLTDVWFKVRGEDVEGQVIEGWTPERRIRVRESDESGQPVSGSVRSILSSSADPLTSIYAEADEDSEVVGQMEARSAVEIFEQTTLQIWFLIRGEAENGTVEGWVPSRYVRELGDGTRGRIEAGNRSEFTTRYIERMVNDRFFWPALRTTLLLIVLIIPAQFILAIIMALVIQADLKGSGIFLYIFAIALGLSDLAVGIVWYSIFTQSGYLNSILQGLGLIDAPITYLSADTRYWILIAVWLAEVWRATALVMVIVVAGMQAISREVLEAAEVFGANLWQRVRYIIIPLLRPSLQVALILRTILAFQVFAVVIVLSGGDIMTVLANETYRQYYELQNFNVAAAYASLILLLSMITSLFYLRAVRTQEEAAG